MADTAAEPKDRDPARATEQTPPEHDLHHLEQQRRANLEQIAALGVDPFGRSADGVITLAAARSAYDPQADEEHQAAGKTPPEGFVDRRPRVTTAGRVVLHRDNGKLVWLNLRDATGDVQVAVSKRDCDETGFAIAKALDLSDHVVAIGPLMKTRAGEVTIWADEIRIGAKSLTPPPEKWAGLQDVEQRARKRYVDLWSNPESARVFTLRSALFAEARRVMGERGYLEVDTPVLQQLAGGAAARPFVTHMNALDIDLFMRIAPELYLKRLLVGGMTRVYELSRNFRNEGVDRTHNPEFTSLEAYEAYGDYHSMARLAEDVISGMARVAAGHAGLESSDGVELPFGELTIDYAAPFERVTFVELFERVLGFGVDDEAKALEAAKSRGLKVMGENGVPLDHVLIVNELFEEVCEPTLDPARPTFVMDYPAALSPLTKGKKGTEGDRVPLAERWDLFIAGMEVGPAYTELNDPDEQAARFRAQLAGIDDEETTFRTFDHDFVEALKVGMPPAGGIGLGMDRLTMLMANQPTLRDVILFPLMRPLAPSSEGG